MNPLRIDRLARRTGSVGGPADTTYPDIAFWIESSAACEEAYSLEFHRQGMAQSASDLQHLGQRSLAAGALDQIMGRPAPAAANWYELTLENGRAWLERGTNLWRQVEIRLPVFGFDAGAAPALAGMLGAGSPTHGADSMHGADSIQLTPENAGFELIVTVAPTAGDAAAKLCCVEASISLTERFGDYSGIEITLFGAEITRKAITDALGKVTFTDIPCAQIASLQLNVVLAP